MGKLTLIFLIFLHTQTVILAQLNNVDTIIYDMEGSHEGAPSSASQYDWSKGPRVAYGNTPPPDWSAFLVWGQVYEQEGGNPSRNTRVKLRKMKAYMLRKSDTQWVLLQNVSKIGGAAYAEDFVDDVSKDADARDEGPGSVSVRVGRGFNYHFWDDAGRVDIDPEDIAGIFTTMEAKSVLHDANDPDDREEAKYLLSVGADYWLDKAAQWDQWKTNGDVAIGKFKYVKPYWRAFSMHSLTEEALRANPPPLQ